MYYLCKDSENTTGRKSAVQRGEPDRALSALSEKEGSLNPGRLSSAETRRQGAIHATAQLIRGRAEMPARLVDPEPVCPFHREPWQA